MNAPQIRQWAKDAVEALPPMMRRGALVVRRAVGSRFTEFRDALRPIVGRVATKFGRSTRAGFEHSKYIDLAPTDKADESGVYAEALVYATNNARISNIALTGPYGSGKSSIIRSFLKNYRRPVLQISLAAFLPEATTEGGKVSKQEIERSILQQMLYGADANKLPLSRFKRIQSPGKGSIFVSLYIALGLVSFWHILGNFNDIVSGDFFLPFSLTNWFNIAAFVVAGSFLWLVSHHLYVASFGVSLKSISLKDIQITPVAATQESILNRHLDEIIYFFQSTRYDLVVIEDLDRFNNSDIFVTLREINSLVNENAGVKRTIRFLYALRDDMFVNTDRTKFFEFIIPVIPIINSSNAIDKVLEQGKRLSLDERLNRQFLREVSRYLNDLRLIQNIFNEYAIYIANLETGDEKVLDPNKLLAVLIYKNVFPRDFESLHRGKGNLAEILGKRDDFIANAEAQHKAEISRLEEQIDTAKRQVPGDLQELRRIYAMALIERLPAQTASIGLDGQGYIDIAALTKNEKFEHIIEAPRIIHRNIHGHTQRLDIVGLQADINPLKTYQQRKVEIERTSTEFINAASKSVRDLRRQIAELRISKFNEVMRLNAADLDEKFGAFGDNAELARFLVFEGYLDDTYYQYTSLFHSGRLSANDNKFLIQIRGFVNPEPDFQIDNPKEVIAAMRDEDFRQSYVLNVKIVDCLLGESSAYAAQTAGLFGCIAADFDQCEAFLTTYYATGTEVSTLVTGLVNTWAGFVPAVLSSPKGLTHMVPLIAHLSPETLRTLPVTHPDISEYVSGNLPSILGSGGDFDPARLKLLKLEIADLASIEAFPGAARFLFEEGLYSLTIDNLDFIFGGVLGLDASGPLRTQNYTTLLETGNAALISRIERDFGGYLRNIVLQLHENSQESIPAILAVIGREDLDPADLRAFLDKQSALLPSFDQIPTPLHALVVQLGKIEPSWTNCIAFLGSENFDADSLTAYLSSERALTELSMHTVPDGEAARALRRFIVDNDAMSDEVYRAYVQRLPRTFSKFPENIGMEKWKILVEEGRIAFSAETLASLGNDRELQVLFVAKNIEKYLADQSAYSADDEFREELLATNIRDVDKLAIVRSMNLAVLANFPSRAGAVGSIIARTGEDVGKLDPGSARAIILNAAPISAQVFLFNKFHAILGDEDVRGILAALPEPFSEITSGYHIPRVPKTQENLELVKWLDSRGIISSWGEAFFSDEIRINLYRR